MQRILFPNAWIIQGIIACKILVAEVNVVFLQKFIAKVSVCEEISGALNIRIYHKC